MLAEKNFEAQQLVARIALTQLAERLERALTVAAEKTHLGQIIRGGKVIRVGLENSGEDSRGLPVVARFGQGSGTKIEHAEIVRRRALQGIEHRHRTLVVATIVVLGGLPEHGGKTLLRDERIG